MPQRDNSADDGGVAEQVHLTNWGTMPWSEFETGWTRLVPRLIQMSQRGLVLTRPAIA